MGFGFLLSQTLYPKVQENELPELMETKRPEGTRQIDSTSSLPPIHPQAQFPSVAEQMKLESDCLSLSTVYYEAAASMITLCYFSSFLPSPSLSLTLTALGLCLLYKA